MNRFRRLVIVLSVTLALAGSLFLVWNGLGARNILGAFLLALLPTSWMPSVRCAFLPRLPEGYYRLRSWERNPRLFQRLGVRWFQRLLRIPLLALCNRAIPRSFQQKDFLRLEREMRFAETSHLLSLLLTLLFTLIAGAKGWRDALAYLTCWNLLINVYPILLQRFNRGRLADLMARRDRTEGKTTERRE